MSIGLDKALDLIIPVEVDWISLKLNLLLQNWLETFDNQFDFDSSIGSENVSRVHFAHLERPVRDQYHVRGKVRDVDASVLGFEVGDGLGSEVARQVEPGVSDQEVASGLLDEALDVFVGNLGGQFGDIASVLEHLGVQLLESRNLLSH